jgi:hypothetical protein
MDLAHIGRRRFGRRRGRAMTRTKEIHMSTKGALIAAMAAGIFTVGAPMLASAKDSAKIHCEGVNACKGKGGCKGADNACKGQNGCKGKGFVEMTDAKCKAKGGTAAPMPEGDKK